MLLLLISSNWISFKHECAGSLLSDHLKYRIRNIIKNTLKKSNCIIL